MAKVDEDGTGLDWGVEDRNGRLTAHVTLLCRTRTG